MRSWDGDPVRRHIKETGMASSRFQGRIVFITGGASGIGEGAARRFAKEGARLAIADINEEGARAVAESLPEAMALRTDTSDPASVERAIAATVDRFGKIDVIFNNAGISGEQKPVHEMSIENWNRVVAIN